jgi:hypothetical protein
MRVKNHFLVGNKKEKRVICVVVYILVTTVSSGWVDSVVQIRLFYDSLNRPCNEPTSSCFDRRRFPL